LRRRTFTFQHLPAAKAYCEVFTQFYPVAIFVDGQGLIKAVQEGLPGIKPSCKVPAVGWPPMTKTTYMPLV